MIAARAVFSYGSVYWFGASLARWMAHHHVTSGAIPDALIFMAVVMLLTRVITMGLRAAHLAPAHRSNGGGITVSGAPLTPPADQPERPSRGSIPETGPDSSPAKWSNLGRQLNDLASRGANSRRAQRAARRGARKNRRAK